MWAVRISPCIRCFRPALFCRWTKPELKLSRRMWRSELERPIYFVETREGYTCCWCSLKGDDIVLHSHPLSPVPVRVLRHPREAEVIGQVVGIALKLGEWRPVVTLRGAESRLERACNTELKWRADPPPRSGGSRAGAWFRSRSINSPAVICNAPLDTTTSSRKARNGVRSSLRNSRRCASARACCAAISP